MIWIPIAIALVLLLRCFVLEKRTRRQERRIERMSKLLSQ